jgi:hypothetical protein
MNINDFTPEEYTTIYKDMKRIHQQMGAYLSKNQVTDMNIIMAYKKLDSGLKELDKFKQLGMGLWFVTPALLLIGMIPAYFLLKNVTDRLRPEIVIPKELWIILGVGVVLALVVPSTIRALQATPPPKKVIEKEIPRLYRVKKEIG